MSRRALTLLEMLIVIGLLAALAAIAVAITVPLLGARAFDQAEDVAVHHLLLARAAARERRESVEVVGHPGSGRLVARPFDPGDPDERDEAGVIRALDEGWAVAVLPGRVRLTRSAPLDPADVRLDFAGSADAGDSDAGDDVERLVVFLPDGSVLLGGTFWLTDDDGRAARVDVHPWTGTPSVRRVDASSPDAADEPDPDEPADDSPEEPEPATPRPDDADRPDAPRESPAPDRRAPIRGTDPGDER